MAFKNAALEAELGTMMGKSFTAPSSTPSTGGRYRNASLEAEIQAAIKKGPIMKGASVKPVQQVTPTKAAPTPTPTQVVKIKPTDTSINLPQLNLGKLGEDITNAVRKIGKDITLKFTPVKQVEIKPITINPNQTQLTPEQLDNLGITSTTKTKQQDSATLTPQAQKSVMEKAKPVVDKISTFNPLDTAITAGQDALAKQAEDQATGKVQTPQLVNSLAFYQKLTEPVLNNKYSRNFVRAEAKSILGSSEKIQQLFDTPLDKPVTVGDKIAATSADMIVGLANLFIGGKGIEALGVSKTAVLPTLFATLGQLGAGPQTTINQRLAKIPVDYLTGWLFNLVPGSKKLFSTETLKGMGIVGAITAPTSFISYLTEGMSAKDAAIAALKASVINAAFHAVMVANSRAQAKLFGEKKYYSTEGSITPEEAKARGIDKINPVIVNKAQAEGKDIKMVGVIAKEGILTKKDIVSAENLKKLGIEVPTVAGKKDGWMIDFELVDKPNVSKLDAGEHTPQEVINKVLSNGLEKTPEGKEIIKAAVEAQGKGMNITIEKTAPVVDGEVLPPEVANTLRKAKGLSVDDIIKQHPDINLKRDVPVTDIHGKKSVIDAGEALTPYELKGNKVLLQDGKTYIVSKNQFQNIKGNAVNAVATPFAPEFKGLEETINSNAGTERQALTPELQKMLKSEDNLGFDTRNAALEAIMTNPDFATRWDIAKEHVDALTKWRNANISWKENKNKTKFSEYQLPGGKNYKEILIKAPVALKTEKFPIKWNERVPGEWNTEINGKTFGIISEFDGKDFYVYQKDGVLGKQVKTFEEAKQAVSDVVKQYEMPQTFGSSHWSDPNVLSHLRLNLRETVDGKKVTFMEELQSDWAREGRSKGFIGDKKLSPKIKAGKKLEAAGYTFDRDMSGEANLMKNGEFVEYDELPQNIKTLVDTYLSGAQTFEELITDGVPNNPLLKKWQELSIKRALQEAVKNDSEYLAWTNGAQQQARYNLSKEVEKVSWIKDSAGKQVTIKPIKTDKIIFYVDDAGKILREGANLQADWVGKPVSEIISKGLGEKINKESSGELSGEGLNVGGEWANTLYDKQVKNIVQDITGGKVETINLDLPISVLKDTFISLQTAKPLTIEDLKVGGKIKRIQDNGRIAYVITEVLGSGKFKAVTQQFYTAYSGGKGLDEQLLDIWKDGNKTFDITIQKSEGQQAIKLTPEIKAIIKGEAPILKKPSGANPFEKKVFDYQSTQLNLPKEESKDILSFVNEIPEGDLFKNPKENYTAQQTGREDQPHVTVLYGIDPKVDVQKIKDVVKGTGPIEITLGKTSTFTTNKDYDVLKVDVKSDELNSVNKIIDEKVGAPGSTFKDYKPHITLAYLKKGSGEKYINSTEFEGKKITLKSLAFSTTKGEMVEIPLTPSLPSPAEGIAPIEAIKRQEGSDRGGVEAPKTYIHQWDGRGKKLIFVEVKGKLINLIPGVDTFIHKNNSGQWVISDRRTGLAISRAMPTQKAAIEDFKTITKAVEKSGKSVKQYIEKKVKIHGETPGYTKKSIEKNKPTKESGGNLGFNPKNLEEPTSPKAKEEVKKIIKQSEIAKALSEKLNVPMRRGMFRLAGAIGIYKPNAKVIRLKSGGLQTVFHEVAHYIDDTIFNFSKDISSTERRALMEEYGKSYEGQPHKQRQEAFAEYLRFKMTGQQEKIDKYGPELDKKFNEEINKYPQVKEILVDAIRDYKRWQEQPAVAKVLSHIAIGPQSKGSLASRVSQTAHNLYTAALDDLHPLEEFTKLGVKKIGSLSAIKDPYILAQNLRGWTGKADLFLNKGTFGKTFWETKDGKIVMKFKGKGYSDIIKPIEKKGLLNEFRVYIISQRIVNDLAPREIKSGINLQDAKDALKELGEKYPEFEKVAEARRKYKDELLEYAADNGVLGETGLAKIKELNKFHVPFYRVMEETQSGFLGKTKIAGNLSNPIKKIKGSEREIIDPLESDVKDTYAIINASERNNIGIAMANLAAQDFELQRLFEEVVKPMKPVTVSSKEVLDKIMKETGEEIVVPKDLADIAVTLFRTTYATGPNMLNVNMGDQQKVFQVEPDLFKAIQGLNVEDVGIIMRLLSLPAKLLRAGATLTPDFSIRNPVRDQFTAMVYSKYGFKPGIDLFAGMFELFKKGDVYNLWKAGGGEHAMTVSLDREKLQENLSDVIHNKSIKDSIVDVVKNPLRVLQILSEFGEAGTRLGEMRNALRAMADPITGAFASREVTLDFARIGAKTKGMNVITAFWNANIQGTDMMIRKFKNFPFRTLIKVLLGITLPSILLYMVNRKDKRWKEIPRWQKDLFWIVMTNKNIWRIPKPFELGVIFGSVPERIMEYLDNKDPEIFNQLAVTAMDGFTPGFLPTSLIPIIENITNYSFFRDRPIVKRGLEGLPASEQSDTYTSELAKIMGQIGYSPAKIDNFIQGYTGGLGNYAVKGIDKILEGTGIVHKPTEPKASLSDTPILKAFMIRNPIGSSSESVNRVYNYYGKVTAEHNLMVKMIKAGDFDKTTKYLKSHPEILTYKILSGAITDWGDINKIVDKIRNSNMTPLQKKEKINSLYQLQTDMAVKVIEQYRNQPGLK